MSIIGDDQRATIARGSGRVPVGPLVFKTSGAALGAARWVRLPRAPAMEGTCRRIARDRRASSACWPPSGGAPGSGPMPTRWPSWRAKWWPTNARGSRRATSRPASTTLATEVHVRLAAFTDPLRSGLTPVLNATGVILHTNLGRAPWPAEAIEAADAGGGRLLAARARPRRRGAGGRASAPAEAHLIALTGAEDALVTVNNAAALALAVGLAGRRGVAVSRGELVEIGGGVRIPEIVRRAGARLVEVGTTNRTRAADFDGPLALGQATVVLRVHPSNFAQAGFVEAPDPVEVARVAHEHGAIVVDDLGSGALLDTARYGLAHEPMPAERLAAGADLVTFSGDKLVGGPQAGLIVGRADLDRPDPARSAGPRRPTREGHRWPPSPRRSACIGPGWRRPASRSGG